MIPFSFAGRPVWNAFYGPYGQYTANVTTYAPVNRFAGEMYDASTGLYDFGFRHYQEGHGRFMSEDPIQSSLNQYTYCDHDPVNYVDRDGLFFETLFDIGAVTWDIMELYNHPTWENLGWLLVDVGCALVPFVPAVGGIVRAGKTVDRAMDAGRVIGRGDDFSRSLKAGSIDELNHIAIQGRRVKVELTSDVDLFRVCGGGSGHLGRSWTTVDPRGMSWVEYKLAAGLPDMNSMTTIVKGRAKAGSIVEVLPSMPYDSRFLGYLPGGLPEIRVNPSQIELLGDPIRWW